MASLDDLFKMAEGASKNIDITSNNDFELTAESLDIEILDWMMLTLCSNLDISKSAFKGGYMLNKLLPSGTARATIDVDLSIMDKSYYEVVKNCMNYIGSELLKHNIISAYEVKDTVEETMSGGIKLHRNGKKDLGIDVGLHDISYGTMNVNVLGNDINAFSPERMLADKISAMYSRKRFRRSKDLYDFYIITNYFDVDLGVLLDYINKRGQIEWDRSPFDLTVLKEYKKAYDKLIVADYHGNELSDQRPDFESIIERLSLFMDNLSSGKRWDHVKWRISDVQ